jgi:hypothetical protein
MKYSAREEVVTMDCIKPHLGSGPVVPVSLPTSGYPPLQQGISTTSLSTALEISAAGM